MNLPESIPVKDINRDSLYEQAADLYGAGWPELMNLILIYAGTWSRRFIFSSGAALRISITDVLSEHGYTVSLITWGPDT